MSEDKKDATVVKEGPYDWNIGDLKGHLQAAVDLEFWTIPFYMSALYSIKDPSSFAYQLAQSVVYQEMFHVVMAANIGNAYGADIQFGAPVYKGTEIPHLDFNLDDPNPTTIFTPYSAEIGPLDIKRLNSMCLIEYPDWRTGHLPCFKRNVTEYGSIGEFYTAVELGAAELVDHLQGNRNQVDIFDNYYNNFDQTGANISGAAVECLKPTITRDKAEGLAQAVNIVTAICDQGEGQRQGDADIPPEYQNTADDIRPGWTHFKKFDFIRMSKELPQTYEYEPAPGAKGRVAQDILVENFTDFRKTLVEMFSGKKTDGFGMQMATLGGNILNCWKNGAAPKFS